MNEGPAVSIILFLILISLDMIFFGFGEAIQYLNHKEIDRKTHEEKGIRSKRLLKIISDPTPFENTMHLVTTVIHIVIGGSYLSLWYNGVNNFVKLRTDGLIDQSTYFSVETVETISLVITAIVIIYIILTFGVLIPKRIAAKFPERYASLLITPVYYIVKILSPLIGIVSLTAKGFLRILGIKEVVEESDVTEEEIISMINEGQEQGVFHASEAEIMTNIFEYGDKEAIDIMTQRKNINAIDAKTPLSEAVAYIVQERNSRFPVFMDSIDSIIGILHLKDALRYHAKDSSLDKPICEIEGLIREAEFIPERRNIDVLFKNMQTLKIQIVIVVDEYGQTAGVVCMEDILEEIFGNILDEYDEEEEVYIEETSENKYILEGFSRLEDLSDRFGIEFSEEEFETLNGFLIAKMERIPEDNDKFEIEVSGYNFKVLKVENKMIQSVSLTKIKEEIVEKDIIEIED